MKTQSYLARKFLSGKGRGWLSSSLTLMAIFGVVVSVMAFIVVEAVMGGLNKHLRSKILGFSSHITLDLSSEGSDRSNLMKKVLANPQVIEANHFLEGEAILRTKEGESQGVRVRGFDIQAHPKVKDLKIFFEEGEDWNSLVGSTSELPGILLGTELASDMDIIPTLGEKVELLYPFGDVGPTGEIEPNVRAYRVVGLFQSDYYEYDSKFALVNLEEGRFLFGDRSVERIGIFVKKPEKVVAQKGDFEGLPGVDRVQTWTEQHARMFSAFKLEKIGMGFVLGLMLVLASFNILSMLMMVVYERRREIAVVRALGLNQKEIAGIFFRGALWIGFIGSVLGVWLGWGICRWLASANIRLPSVYYIESLPVDFRWSIFVLAILLAPLLALLATVIPAREGKKISIVKALRYE